MPILVNIAAGALMMVAFFATTMPYVVPTTMIDVIKHLGFTAGLKLVLDAGDAASYTSGQKWLDRSGNAEDFYLGSGSGSEAADPVFNGVAGRQSSGEYFSYDGDSYFTLDTANPTWVNNLHKDGAKFSFAGWVYLTAYPTDGVDVILLFSSASYSAESAIGQSACIKAGGWLHIQAFTPTDTVIDIKLSGVPLNAWTYVAGTLDESAGTATLQINGTQAARSGTFTNPSAASATDVLSIGNAGGIITPNGRVANWSMWEGTALTAAQMNSIYLTTKAKFGL